MVVYKFCLIYSSLGFMGSKCSLALMEPASLLLLFVGLFPLLDQQLDGQGTRTWRLLTRDIQQHNLERVFGATVPRILSFRLVFSSHHITLKSTLEYVNKQNA